MALRTLFKSFLTRAAWTCKSIQERRRLLAQLPPLSKSAFDIFLEEDVMPFNDQWIAYVIETGEHKVYPAWEYAFDLTELIEKINFNYPGAEILRAYSPELDIYEGTTCIAKGQKQLTNDQLYVLGVGCTGEEKQNDQLSDWPYDQPANDFEAEEGEGEREADLLENQWKCNVVVVYDKAQPTEFTAETHETIEAESFPQAVNMLRRRHAGQNWCVIRARDWHNQTYHYCSEYDEAGHYGKLIAVDLTAEMTS